ncbi:hypothetical protein KAX17_01815 [Candidatus Bipolaricaulota bacterium]|nr:hypothetical protein [Candidatus Bipolaricaulota bacterium]
MAKKFLTGFLTGTLVIACIASSVFGASASDRPETILGFSLPTFGSVHYDDEGNLKSVTGFNLGLGYSTRYYRAENGLQPNRFNGYWGWGTILLLLPYFEFGVSYPFEIAGGTQYVVLDLGFIYIVPAIGLSIYF